MSFSVFDLFSIGIGPSSSHTVGPMRAARGFVGQLSIKGQLDNVARIQTDLYGSLALTGVGHGTDLAVLMGLEGESPEGIDPTTVKSRIEEIESLKKINLDSEKIVNFDIKTDLLFHIEIALPKHANGMKFTAFDEKENIIKEETYYSIGGGFIVTDEEFDNPKQTLKTEPYPFDTARELLDHCHQQKMTIAEIMLENEKTWRTEEEIHERLLLIDQVMMDSIKAGCSAKGILPGGLNVKRRAAEQYEKQVKLLEQKPEEIVRWDWLNIYAMAVNEENAAGGRVVTAPTNGAAGIIPSVLKYYKKFYKHANEEGVITFLLTAGAIAILYKKGASISGAEMGCQGEVGVACSMAAGAYTAVLGGSLEQVENAAEIGMEHNLGLTCDPIKGLVQVPCIERNAMGAVKAVNASRLALAGDGSHLVFLDKVIATMRQTGIDMQTIYKETSLGGLAVNVPEC